jgi:hypothetical protein
MADYIATRIEEAVKALEGQVKTEGVEDEFCKYWLKAKEIIRMVCKAVGGGVVCDIIINVGDRYYEKNCPKKAGTTG